MALFVGYYRVSTQAQGKSGLGLDAQQHAVQSYVESVGGKLVHEFQEIESGGKSERPRLQDALRYCKAKRAMLVIAKLDRLARNVHFISQLMESGIEFIAADMPTANKLTIHIIAAMAEYERDVISQRTKQSLQAAKARGKKLGNPTVGKQSKKGVRRNQEIADDFARKVLPAINAFKSTGIATYSKLAMALDMTGVKTQRGRTWTAAGVRNVVLRAEAAESKAAKSRKRSSQY